MKALTIRQPWASLIAHGVKTIETRSRSTKYRGRIAIHAGQVGSGFFYCRYVDNVLLGARATETRPRELRLPDGTMVPDPGIDTWPKGAVVATAVLTDCVPVHEWLCSCHRSDGVYALVGPSSGNDIVGIFQHPGGEAVKLPHWAPSNLDCLDNRHPRQQEPFGDFRCGRWAWLLDDIKPTRDRCPACWGRGKREGWPVTPERFRCPTCTGTGGCEPVSARGRQGLWNWEPVEVER